MKKSFQLSSRILTHSNVCKHEMTTVFALSYKIFDSFFFIQQIQSVKTNIVQKVLFLLKFCCFINKAALNWTIEWINSMGIWQVISNDYDFRINTAVLFCAAFSQFKKTFILCTLSTWWTPLSYQSASFLRWSLQLSGGDTVFLRHTTDSFVKSSHVVLFHGFLHLSNYFLFMLLFLSAMNPFVGCLCFLVCSNGYRTPTSEMIQTKMLPPIRYVPENKLNQNVFSVNLQGGWMASFLIHN